MKNPVDTSFFKTKRNRAKKRKIKTLLQDSSISKEQRLYLAECRRTSRLVVFLQWSIFLAFLLFWEFGSRAGIINAFVFSSPSRIVQTIITMLQDGTLLYHVGITLFETFASFTLVLVIGLATAVLLWWNKKLARIFDPYLVVLNSLPKSALAPVFIVWLGNNMKTIIVAALSVAVFGTILSLYHCFSHTEEDKIKLIQTLGGSKRDVLTKVVLPASLPTLLNIMKVNIGLSLVGVIIGEFLAAKAGLGYLIVYGSQVFKLDWVMMSIVLLCILATGLYQFLAYLEKKYA